MFQTLGGPVSPTPWHAPTLIFTSFGANFFTSLNSLSPKPEWARRENLMSTRWAQQDVAASWGRALRPKPNL